MQRPLTSNELQILRAIRDLSKANGVPPTYGQIAEAVGKGQSTIRHTLRRFIEFGLLEKKAGVTHQNLYLTKEGLIAAKNGRRKYRRAK